MSDLNRGWPVAPEHSGMPDLLEMAGAFEQPRAQMPLPGRKKNKVTNHKPRGLREAEDKGIIALYKRGYTYDYIKSFFNIGGKKVRAALKDAGIKVDVMNRNTEQAVMPPVSELIANYTIGSLLILSRRYDVPIRIIKVWLNDCGIPLKKPRGPNRG